MEDNEMVNQLLRGSWDIDRMKKDIEQIVRMVRGLVAPSLESMRVPDLGLQMTIYKSPSCVWRMHILGKGFGCLSQRTEVYCELSCHGQPERGLVTHYRHIHGGDTGLSVENVRRVYESLPKFLEGMLNTFPELKERFKPFIDEATRLGF